MAPGVSKKDLNPMDYREYEEVMGKLVRKIKAYLKKKKIEFDIVAPILRSGGIPGLMIAVHFEVIKILPLQFKHFYNPKEIKQVLTIPKLLQEIPGRPNILIVENNTITGSTAKKAIAAIKKAFPNARLYYATAFKAYDGPKKFDGVEEYFWGIMSDENQTADGQCLKKLRLRPKITIAPWECSDYEIRAINAWID